MIQVDRFIIMEFTQEVRDATDPIYKKFSKVLPEIEWSVHAPYIHRINQLKKILILSIKKFLKLCLK